MKIFAIWVLSVLFCFAVHSQELTPGAALPESARSESLQHILDAVTAELPNGSKQLVRDGSLSISLVELEHGSTKRSWAGVNERHSLCGASTLKIFCAIAAFEAEARGLLKISKSHPTTMSQSKASETYINASDIESSVVYTKGPRQGNRDAGKVCSAINDAYLRSQGLNLNTSSYYQPCFTNILLSDWGLVDKIDGNLSQGLALGLLYGSQPTRRCSVLPSPRSFGIPTLSTQRASSHKLSALWTAIELNEFPNIKPERMNYFKQLIYGGLRQKGKIGRSFCTSKTQCFNKYGKTGTWTSKKNNTYCENDSRVLEYPRNKGKKLVLTVLCNDKYKSNACKKDKVIRLVSQKIKRQMEKRWGNQVGSTTPELNSPTSTK